MSLVKPLKLYFLKKWDFQKARYEKVIFEKTECLVKSIKKCFLKKPSIWLALKSGGLRGKLPKRTMYI